MGALDASGDIAGDIESSAQAFVTALNTAMGSGNLSVFMPGSDGAGAADYNAGNYRFVAESSWNSFITTVYS